MKGQYNRGLLVYTARWTRESGRLRDFFPALCYHAFSCIRNYGKRRNLANFIDFFQSRAVAPLFSQIEIETQNRCNAACAFCPVNRNAPQRPYARMSEEMFASIIEQLASLQFSNSLSLHSNNEPLLDKRLPEFAALAKMRLPRAHIKMFTNGVLLTLDLFRCLLPSFDRIFINNYNTTPDMHPNIKEIHDFCQTPEGEKLLSGKTVVIQLRNPNVVLSSRGGNAPNRQPPAQPPRFKCWYPYQQFVIRPTGQVSLCCNDALGNMTLGDLTEHSILEVWRGPTATAVRKAMTTQGRAGIPLCAVCDFEK